MRRPGVLASVALISVVVGSGGFALGQSVKQPVDVAAASNESVPVLVAAEERELAATVQIKARAGGSAQVDAAAFLPPGATRSVVTRRTVSVGDDVRTGTVLCEISGRPVVGIEGGVPLYRDLRYGDTGDDVARVQQVLVSRGHLSGRSDGTFGAATQAALRRFYRSLGYTAPVTEVEAAVSSSATTDGGGGVDTGQGPAPDAPAGPGQPAAAPEPAANVGPWLPAGEWSVVPRPGTVAVAAPLGSVLEVGAACATTSVGEWSMTGRADVAQAGSFAKGTPVTVVLDGRSEPVAASVSHVSDLRVPEPDAGPADYPGHDVTVTAADPSLTDLPRDATGSIRYQAPPTTMVAVPLTAIRHDDRGTYVLVRRRPANAPVRVDVAVGLSVDGWAGLEGAGLAVGDVVQVMP